ncbi:MAG: DUF3108 domain-containing protein [Xanthomonadaceae bacterium]|nr:DUF3108 domain-containing protein [Xanthomonadaceae bacterium]
MLAAGSNTRAAEPLEPFHPHQARFEVSRNNAGIGFLRAELSRRDDGLWNYRLESEATAWYIRLLGISTVESVWFDWRDGRVLPLTYHHVSREPGSDRFWQHRYLWPELQTRTETLQGEFEIEIEPGVVDPLSLRMAVAAHLSKSPQALEDLEFQVIERDEVERQQYRFLRAFARPDRAATTRSGIRQRWAGCRSRSCIRTRTSRSVFRWSTGTRPTAMRYRRKSPAISCHRNRDAQFHRQPVGRFFCAARLPRGPID